MKKISEIKRKIIRYFCTGICLTSAAFVFQACYGPMPDDKQEVIISGRVTTSTNMPVPNVSIWSKSANAQLQFETVTEDNGYFEFNTIKRDAYNLSFESPDSRFLPKDTIITFSGVEKVLNISLNAR